MRSGWVAAPTFALVLLVLLARRVWRRAVSGFPGASMEHPAGWFLRCRDSSQSRYRRCLASATQTRGERKPYGKGTTSESLKSRMRQGVGKNFRSGSEDRVPKHLFRPVLLPLEGGSKTGRHQWLRRLDRIGRVRASVRGHGAQGSARTKAVWSAPPRRQQHDTARSAGVKHAQTRFRLTPALWLAVNWLRATARGSGDFRSGSGELCSTKSGSVSQSQHNPYTPPQFPYTLFIPLVL